MKALKIFITFANNYFDYKCNLLNFALSYGRYQKTFRHY